MRNQYLYELIGACKETHNEVMAAQVANELRVNNHQRDKITTSSSAALHTSHSDMSYKSTALSLIDAIKSTDKEEFLQPREPIQKFFDAIHKIKNFAVKNEILFLAFIAFSKQPNVQWVAFRIAMQDEVTKQGENVRNRYLYDLIGACKETHNKEMAVLAAKELQVDDHERNKIAKLIEDKF